MNDNPLETMKILDPQLMAHLEKTNEIVFADGALPKRVKLLIALAFDAAHGAVGGVTSLAQAAMAAGAGKQEITEALRVAYHLSGVGSVYTASRALKGLAD